MKAVHIRAPEVLTLFARLQASCGAQMIRQDMQASHAGLSCLCKLSCDLFMGS